MELIYQKEKLVELFRYFHTVSGLRIAVFDRDGEEVAAYPKQLCPFCAGLRQVPAALWDCHASDREALERCQEGGRVYRCHMGLTEAAAPIRYGELLLGYIMIGQMLEEQATGYDAVLARCGRYGLGETLSRELGEVTVLPRERIEASMHLMTACTAYILSQELITRQEETLSARVIGLIEAHYTEKLSLAFFCRALSVGKNRLCGAVREETGQTVGQLLEQKRVREAKRLLRETGLPVSAVAGQVGIEDYNYFTKVFRRAVGMTPARFRAQNRKRPD